MSNDERLSFTVSSRGTQYPISCSPETTLAAFQAQLEELTNVPPSFQKLLYKGKNLLSVKSGNTEETTLAEAGFKNGMKGQLTGSTSQDLSSLQSAENEQRKRERIMRERASRAPVKVRNTGSGSNASIQFRFHQLVPLAHLPNPGAALSLLSKLSEDPAIKHVMQKHKFSVGVLTELAPHEHPELLGLNTNAGQAIKLRLRTDRYDGFRLYADVRRVLCHELTHNVWGDHDNNFKELNSQLNREVAEFERAQRQGTHYLSQDGDFYEPSSELHAEAHGYILGGGASTSRPAVDESREERRRRLLDATMARLRKEEEDLEQSCGTKGSETQSN